jgi:hypothetical protein
VEEFEQPPGFFIRDNELDLYCECARQLEEVRLVYDMVPAEACHRAKRGAPPDAEPVRLFEQPFPHEAVVMALAFVRIESQ